MAEWTPRAVEEAYSLRAVLERLAIQEAAKRAGDEDIARLQSTVDEMAARAREGNSRALVRLDLGFHAQIYALSGHSLLQRTLSQLRRQLYCLLGLDRGFALHCNEFAADHQLIVDLLRAGNGDAAGEAVAAHILAAGAEVMEQVRDLEPSSPH